MPAPHPRPPARLARALRAAACGLAAAWLAAAAPQAAGAAGGAGAPPAPKVLRLAFAGSENGFDPAQVSDVVSAALVGSLFDSPLTYDYLARPLKLKPRAAAALPEVNADHTRFVFRIRPGQHFADDPAFKGQRRELTAHDYVYSVKRYYDPAVRSPTVFHHQNAGLLGLSELRQQAIEQKKPFDYDREVEGIRALDRYTFEVRTARPAPRLPYVFATPALSGAVAREVVHGHPSRAMERPVGTGAFVLKEWKRRARIVLERNPRHDAVYDEQPTPGDTAARALAERLRGRRLPMLDRVEFSIIEEAQPRWLAFLKGELDLVPVPAEFSHIASPGGTLAPHLARRGIVQHRAPQPQTWYVYFGMENPVVGGYSPEQVALRRAIALAYDAPREIALVRKGQMMPAQSVLPPLVSGYDPALKTEMGDHDPLRAKALLDLYGFVDRDGDGWRERPDGQPLVLEMSTEPSQLSRALQEVWRKSLDVIGIRVVFRTATWQENIKASRAGQLMMWTTGWSGALPDGGYFLDVLYGPNKGQANHARFDLPAFNALYERQRALPDGPERDALIQQALRLSVAYMPIKASGHVIGLWLSHPHVVGYQPHPFIRDYWRYLDLDPREAAP
jgi:ABC-type transport system substrate-binding protein